MDLLIRIVCGMLGVLVFCIMALGVHGEDTVMGRVLERTIPRFFQQGHTCYVRPGAVVDITRDPPEFLGVDAAGDRAAAARGLEEWHIAHVSLIGREWYGEGFWFPTCRGVETEIEVYSAACIVTPDPAANPFDDAFREKVGAVGLAGLRTEIPNHPWLQPAGLDTAPFKSDTRTEPRRTAEVFWEGYIMNGGTLLALGVIVWAVWPRRKGSR